MIGDKDPEDAYDAGDPVEVRLDVLERIVEDLRDGIPDPTRFDARRVDALRLVVNLEAHAGADHPRLRALRAELEWL